LPITPDTLRLLEQLRASIGDILDARTRTTTAAWVRAWDALAPAITSGIDDLLAAVAANKTAARSTVLRTQRLMAALDATRLRLEQLHADAAAGGRRDVAAGVPTEAQVQGELIVSQLPPSAWDPRVAPATDLDAIVSRAGQQITVLSRPLSEDATQSMLRSLIRGIAGGENPRTVARWMLSGVEGEFNGGLARALTISRTEMLDALRSAAAAQQWANKDVLGGWQWWSALDSRVCPSCWSKHGNEYPLSVPGPWDHPRGRCTRLPLVKPWKDLGITMPEPASAAPASARAVFDALPAADQLAIMGPGRLAALKSGTASWPDLSMRRNAPTWRPSYVATPVSKLLAA
jgi:hypothetical protein